MIDTIICGNARDLAAAIPDESVAMVFTDPVYDRIDDYVWLAHEAMRVLTPDGAMLVWASNHDQFAVHAAVSPIMPFVLPLVYTKVAKTYKAFGYKTFLWTTPCLWFQKGSPNKHDWLIDTVIDHSNAIVSTDVPPSKSYKWHKNPEAYSKWLLAFTKPGAVVWDPFTGSGSLPCVCKQLGRHVIASEIDPTVARTAQDRYANTQAPASVFAPEQLALLDA
jgi:hypothetical protein